MRSRSLSLGLAAAAILATLVACGDDPAPTPTATASPALIATATASASVAVQRIEEIDFTDVAVIGPLIDHFGGGEIDPRRVQYLDLTRDGTDDAFVIIESGGTAGDVGAALLRLEDGGPQIAGYIPTGGRIDVRFPEVGGGIVVTTEGVWDPGDAECCPSKLRESTYEWEEGEFVLRDEQVVDNPDVEDE
ncbi:MAG: hypothetical protein AB7F65_02445 [Dehalococcoidia bacterium]